MDIEEQYDKIYRFCYYKVHNRQIAEDLTQETFLRFLKSGYTEQGKGIRYLYTIARNLCVEEGRKQKWKEVPEEDISDGGAFSDDLIEKIYMRQALMKLSEKDRELLILRYVNEESVSAICEVAGISRFALYRRLKCIQKEMKELLEGGSSDGEKVQKSDQAGGR
ncbi:MAG: sigma-70 family RNA polymerase sigma factor [Lachnospiraceae bacterium]|nr:sigma-70 family RNA polymerase sigma factor [Lachnospiraceae bacterium]